MSYYPGFVNNETKKWPRLPVQMIQGWVLTQIDTARSSENRVGSGTTEEISGGSCLDILQSS